MYRLIKFERLKTNLKRNITYPGCKFCPLCGIKNFGFPNHDKDTFTPNMSVRWHNTNTDVLLNNDLIQKLKRSQKRRKNFFAELVEVFENTNSDHQAKAPVKKLKPLDVSLIATTPNIQLDCVDQIGKLRAKEKKVLLAKVESDLESSKNGTMLAQQRDFGTSKELSNSDVTTPSLHLSEHTMDKMVRPKAQAIEDEDSESTNILNDQEMRDIISTSLADPRFQDPTVQESIVDDYDHNEDIEQDLDLEHKEDTTQSLQGTTNKVVKKRFFIRRKPTKDDLARIKKAKLEKEYKENAFNATLYAYLRLCASSDLLHKGWSTLTQQIYRSKISPKHPKIINVGPFEVLMNGYASKANTNKVEELWKMMMSAKIKPTLNVYTSLLECAARSNRGVHEIQEILTSLHDEGYQLNDIFLKSTFVRDQREVVLRAVKQVVPDFEPVIPPPLMCYSCSLLQKINEQQGKNLNIRSPAGKLFTKAQLHKFADEQFQNEFSFYLKVKSIEKRIEPIGYLQLHRLKLESMKQLWLEDLKKGFNRDVAILKMANMHAAIGLLPYLKVLDSQDYIDIMMKEVQRLAEGSETFSPTTIQLYKNVGNQVKSRYVNKLKKMNGVIDKTKKIYAKYCDWYLDPSVHNRRSSNGRQEWQQLVHQHQEGPSIPGDEEFWPAPVLIGVGRFLYNILIGDVKIDANILHKASKNAKLLPAFYRVYRPQGFKQVEEIKPHPVISKLYRAAGEEHLHFDISLVPMVSPPLPWTSYQSGGYLVSKTDIIRLPDQAMHQRQRLKEANPQQLYPSLDSLNQLASVPWCINKPVLDTVMEVFNSGGNTRLDIPEPPHTSLPPVPVWPDMTKEQRYEAYRMRLIQRRQKAEMYSLWCDTLYKLSLANHFRDRVFWMPHNMDFRGRVYPCPPHLNHLGADMARSLLCFAEGQPLGPSGLDWLKIHLVNLLGTKKRDAVEDRLVFANSIMPDLLDSAEKPLTGHKWWMESETPWQTLACCMEIKAALQHPGGPHNFVSNFPIHQDGSCNGLQHYAALGRDQAGAASVNLMPQTLPQDVYSCVAALVERERAKDSEAGVAVAKELDGFVRRKVIKQTVMTTVYGVTRFGARLQIAKQLKDIESFPKEFVWPASTYLVAKTFESLREMFKSTKEIQDWFTECARQVAQVCGKKMEYVTPLGLPVVQYYVRMPKKGMPELNKFGQIQHFFLMDMFERPNVMKQKNAFPPNFIHSLDSSHMMLTSIHCEQKGITFVSVHDCYWTHANSVHIMNKICREQFVALHSQPILENLSDFMVENYVGHQKNRLDCTRVDDSKQELHRILTQVPPKGTFVLKNVLDSVYFFS